MKIELKEEERIDDLEYKGLKIIQNKKGFCFGLDSVLLSEFASEIKPNSIVADLGTGTGILGILLCGKTKLSKMIGVEVQQEVAQMAKRSILLNKLENIFFIKEANIKDYAQEFIKEEFDCIVTNPPYKKQNTGVKCENSIQLISRHETEATLEDFLECSSYMLKEKGSFYMVHRPERIADILVNMRRYHLEPKIITFVYPKVDKSANLVLIKAVKGAKEFLKITKPIIIYEKEGGYTQTVLEMYHRKEVEDGR